MTGNRKCYHQNNSYYVISVRTDEINILKLTNEQKYFLYISYIGADIIYFNTLRFGRLIADWSIENMFLDTKLDARILQKNEKNKIS